MTHTKGLGLWGGGRRLGAGMAHSSVPRCLVPVIDWATRLGRKKKKKKKKSQEGWRGDWVERHRGERGRGREEREKEGGREREREREIGRDVRRRKHFLRVCFPLLTSSGDDKSEHIRHPMTHSHTSDFT